MTVRIRITKTPPGFASERIRRAWVGVEMPAESDNGDVKGWSGNENAGGYIVSGVDAVNALLAAQKTEDDAGNTLLTADKTEAARFWSNPFPSTGLRFGADYCEVVSE